MTVPKNLPVSAFSAGPLTRAIKYLSFGSYRVRQDLDGSFPNVNYTFADQEDDDETGLYNYRARLYDPLLGRFISADSIVPEPGNLQAFNRYSYCVNNPLVYVDPSGHLFGIDDLIVIGVAVAIGAAAGASYAAITGGDIATGALTGAVSAACFYAAGGIIGAYGLTSQSLAGVVARSAIHVAAGGVSGGINAAITGGDVAMGALVGGISAGVAKGLGGYIPGNLTGNSYVDFGIGLVEHAAIGGITGGVAAELYGGSFGEGFEQGAMAAGYGYIFNKGGKRIREWFGILNKPSITPTEEKKATTSPARPPRPGYYYEIDKTAYQSCVASEMVSGPMPIAFGALMVSKHPAVALVAATCMVIEASNIVSRCRQEATREYKWPSIEDFR